MVEYGYHRQVPVGVCGVGFFTESIFVLVCICVACDKCWHTVNRNFIFVIGMRMTYVLFVCFFDVYCFIAVPVGG